MPRLSTILTPRLSTLLREPVMRSSHSTFALNNVWRSVWSGLVAASVALGAAGPGAPVQIRDIDGRTLKPFEPAGRGERDLLCRDRLSGVQLVRARDPARVPGVRPQGRGVLPDVRGRREVAGARLDDAVRKHLQEYGYDGIPAAIDRSRVIAKHANASVTPQAVVVDRTGDDSVPRPDRQLLCGARKTPAAGHRT